MTLHPHPATTIGTQVSWLPMGRATRRRETQHHAPQLDHERFFYARQHRERFRRRRHHCPGCSGCPGCIGVVGFSTGIRQSTNGQSCRSDCCPGRNVCGTQDSGVGLPCGDRCRSPVQHGPDGSPGTRPCVGGARWCHRRRYRGRRFPCDGSLLRRVIDTAIKRSPCR